MKLPHPIFRLKRMAKQMARDKDIPLHQALDTLAKSEGFRSWSHLAIKQATAPSTTDLLNTFQPGELALIAGRPGQGKTMFALDILVEAARTGRPAIFFTLEYNEEVATRALASREAQGVLLDTSDNICASYVIDYLESWASNSVAVIDYLQLLDQKRMHPPLAEQMRDLKAFALQSGITLIFLSQVDRKFDLSDRNIPRLRDIRLPNPIDLEVFDTCCFLHKGVFQLSTARPS